MHLDDSKQQAVVRQARARAAMTGELEASEAALAFAQRKYDRIESMKDNTAISALQRDEVRTELELARKQLKQARENRDLARLDLARARTELDKRTIRSPVSGIIVDRFVSPGEYVNDTPLLRLAQMDPLRVETLAPAALFGRVKSGMQAVVTTEAQPDAALLANVTVVDRLIDPASGTFGIRLELANPDYAIPSGLNCRLTLRPIVAEQAPSSDEPPVAAAPETAAVDTVAVAERQTEPKPATDLTRIATDRPESDEATVCVALGPISDDAVRDDLVEALRADDLTVAPRSEDLDEVIGYFVATPPTPTIAESRSIAQRFRALGESDIALLTKRPEGIRVSLGLYSKPESAAARRDELAALDADVAVEVLPRTRSGVSHWIELQANAQTIEQRPWQELAPSLDAARCADDGLMADTLSLEP